MDSYAWTYSDHAFALRRYRRCGLSLIVLFLMTFGAWSVMAPLSSAIIASGHFEIDGHIKKIQHKSGGIVSEILVREGQRVSEGETLLRLDDTNARSELQIIEHQLAELHMTAERLRAERGGVDHFQPPEYFSAAYLATNKSLYERETQLLTARFNARLGQKNQLAERVAQMVNQTSGLSVQVEAKIRERGLVAVELENLHSLLDRKLIQAGQVRLLERNAAELDGEVGQLQASGAEIRGRIAETKLQILNIDQIAVADASKELVEIEGKINQLSERRVEAKDALARVSLKAPLSGVVHELSVHTVGGVVGSAEVLMMIVPEFARLNVEIRVSPQEVDSVHKGDRTMVRIVGLNQAVTPDLKAEVELVGADLVKDTANQISYYPVRVRFLDGELQRLKDVQLVPGMPVDAFVTTTTRTFLTYLLEPVGDRISRAVRER